MTKRLVSLFFALLMLASVLTVGFNAYAEDLDTPVDEEIIEEYQVISNNSYGIYISGLKATCSGRVTAQYSTTLKIKLELQKKSGGTYSTIQTWSDSRTGYTLALDGSKIINPLSSYRLKATFTAGNETVVRYDYP